MSQPNTSEPTGVGAEAADEAAESSAGDVGVPGAAERAGERVTPAGAASDSAADDAGGGDVTGGGVTSAGGADDGTGAATPAAGGRVGRDEGAGRDGEGLPGLATGTAGGNGIGGGEGSTSGPVDTEDTGTAGG
jgi:hypothetical protein